MEQLTNPLFLKEESTRAQVAVVYGIAGLLAGMLFLGGKK